MMRPGRGAVRAASSAVAAGLVAFHDAELLEQVRRYVPVSIVESTQSSMWIPLALMVGGMAALLAWALARGQFRDAEAPKHRVLELEKEGRVDLDR